MVDIRVEVVYSRLPLTALVKTIGVEVEVEVDVDVCNAIFAFCEQYINYCKNHRNGGGHLREVL